MGDSYDWLVTFTYFLGDVFWQPSAVCMLLEALNPEFEGKYASLTPYMHTYGCKMGLTVCSRLL